jgi:glucose-1-phosphate adenylyltransferase
MGVYVFATHVLVDELRRDAAEPDSSRDFGKDLIPHLVKDGKAVAHRFPRSCVRNSNEAEAYWRDVGTLDAYWAANIDLTHATPGLDLYDTSWPIWTHAEITPPAKVLQADGQGGEVIDSVLSGGCIVAGAGVRSSLLFTGSRVHPGAQLEDAVVLPGVEVGGNARLREVIVDQCSYYGIGGSRHHHTPDMF